MASDACISHVLKYPKAQKLARVTLSRRLSPDEVNTLLLNVTSAVVCQRLDKPSVIMVPAQQKQAALDLAASMGVK